MNWYEHFSSINTSRNSEPFIFIFNFYTSVVMNRPLPIKPPRSIKKQPIRNPSYSLFDTMSPSMDWLNTSKRKHSVSSLEETSNHKDAGFWRRASLPNHFISSVKQDCDHSMLDVCQDCITKV